MANTTTTGTGEAGNEVAERRSPRGVTLNLPFVTATFRSRETHLPKVRVPDKQEVLFAAHTVGGTCPRPGRRCISAASPHWLRSRSSSGPLRWRSGPGPRSWGARRATSRSEKPGANRSRKYRPSRPARPRRAPRHRRRAPRLRRRAPDRRSPVGRPLPGLTARHRRADPRHPTAAAWFCTGRSA
jgi:hypothetical protein